MYAGLIRFADGGEKNLAVERIADDLKVTKGSYYYYFKNREKYIRAVLDYSLKIGTEEFIVEASKKNNPLDQLKTLTIHILESIEGKDFDFYLRDFAKNHTYAKKLVVKMDDRRITFVANLLKRYGFNKEDSIAKAKVYYHYYLGWHSRFKHSKINKAMIRSELKIIFELIGLKIN